MSAVASNKLKEGNADITDLSDKFRPTKLSEMFGEMYDNEWSYAFEALKTDDNDDDDVVTELVKLLEVQVLLIKFWSI